MIAEAKADEAVKLAIKMCSENPNANSEAILAIDQRFFCVESKALPGEKIEAISTLMEVFINPPDSAENDEESDLPPASMRRAKQSSD